MEPPSLDLTKVYESKSPQLKREDVTILQKWLNARKYNITSLDEIDLIYFLCECDYDVEKAKKRITGLIVFRSQAKIFQNIDIRSKSVRAAMESVLVSSLKIEDDSCKLAIFIKILPSDPQQIDITNVIKVLLMYVYLWFRRLEPPVDHIIIVDLEVVTLAHLEALNLLPTLKELSCFYNYFSLGTLNKIHFINVGPWIDQLLSILKSTMGADFSEKICVHTNVNNLLEFISLEHLPKELGGNFLAFHQLHEAMKELLGKHADELLKKYEIQSSEFLQIDLKSSHPGVDLFGVDGTFKQLEID